jgi:ribosomal protein L12E/L44/L45/RPP1/RPP2
MTAYTKTTNFAAKDSLLVGNANKIIKGTEHDTEYNNIATAINSKTDASSPTFTGTANFANIASGALSGTTINNSVIGGSTPAAGTFSTFTLASGATATAILDEDNLASNSATALITQQSAKAYVDAQVVAANSLPGALALGNTTGANNIIVNAGQSITTDTISETTAAAGVTVDGVLIKDGEVDGVDVSTLISATTANVVSGLNSATATIQFSKGADVASATGLTLGTDGNYFDITGTTTIATIGTIAIGTTVKLHFDAVLTLTNSADLVLLGGADITTAAGDEAEFVEYASGDWRCTNYSKADGSAIAGGGPLSTIVASGASAIDVETTFDSTYDEYEIVITDLVLSVSGDMSIQMKMGGSYLSTGTYTSHSSLPKSSSSAYAGIGNAGGAIYVHNAILGGSGSNTSLNIRVHSPSSTTVKKLIDWTGSGISAANVVVSLTGGGGNSGTVALTGIRIFPSSGTISGTARLYGIPKS